MIDTETCGSLEAPLVYDLGLAVVDRQGNVYEAYSLVIKEIWEQIDLLKTAYYANKLPNYLKELLEGKRMLVTFDYAQMLVESLCEKYNVKAIIAHNAYFDYKALRNTKMFLTQQKTFLPYEIEIWCTMKMAQSVIATKKSYQKFCKENGYMTNHKTPRPRVTAEVLHRYITNDIDFVESHTGLEDVMIEKEIFAYCVKQKRKMNKALFKK